MCKPKNKDNSLEAKNNDSGHKIENQQKSIEDEAGFISRCFLFYLNPLFMTGSKRLLYHEDLGMTSKMDKCKELYESFNKEWVKETKRPLIKRSLWNTLIRTVGFWRFTFALTLYALYAAAGFGPILILTALLKHFEGTSTLSTTLLWILVALLFVIPMFGSVCSAQNSVMMAHIACQFRNSLIAALYRKSLSLSPAARQKSSTGQIVNMFSNDTAQLQRLMSFLGMIALAPFQIAVALALIYQQVQQATWVGLGFMIFLLPINVLIFGSMTSIRKKKVVITDSRVKMMNEILAGIRVIKLYAWEEAFREKVEEIRKREMILLFQIAYIVAIGFSLVLLAAPVVQPVLVFFTYVKLGNHLDAATAFTTISLFNLMRFPFAFLPMGLAQWSQTKVSLKRMCEFLSGDELVPYVDRRGEMDEGEGEGGAVIAMSGVTMSWIREGEQVAVTPAPSSSPPTAVTAIAVPIKDNSKTENISGLEESKDCHHVADSDNIAREDNEIIPATTVNYSKVSSTDQDTAAPVIAVSSSEEVVVSATPPVNRGIHTLVDVNVAIKKGELVAVVGAVGCGKSSFLSGILGDLNLISGQVKLRGSVAYCDQRPWILNATLQDNVLFGLPYEEERFDEALHAASLDEDVAILPGGVMTEIGERGINLSGGQKARVALARAVYRNADVYLLDDPLSAVDAHVGQHLFSRCIQESLAGKTRVLVTHHVHLLPQCDSIIVLEEGRVKVSGTYEEICNSGIDLESIIPIVPKEEEEGEGDGKESITGSEKINTTDQEGQARRLKVSDDAGELSRLASVRKRKLAKTASTIITLEERDSGNIQKKTYSYYIRAGGVWLIVTLLVALSASQAFDLAANFWLAIWSKDTVDTAKEGGELSSSQNLWYLNIYAVFSMLGVVALTIRSMLLAHHRLGTSLILHSDLLKSILGAPISFFDITPLGRVLNRFSSDITVVDEELSQTLSQLTNSFFQCINSLVAIAATTNGTFLALLVPLYIIYDRIQKFFRKSSTEIQRLESVSRSPIYADFSQALVGVTTIRAYGLESNFIQLMEKSVDHNTVAAVLTQLASQWLSIRLDLIGALIALFIAALAAGAGSSFIPAGYLGLALSASLNLTGYLKFAVRMVATTEAQMNSVERVMHYAQEVEQEGGESNKLPEPPAEWPDKGVIVADSISMRYRDGPLVLKQVSFAVNSAEKVGIAGRTGSGKSSLMTALFRIQELAEGKLFIDGLDTSKIPLRALRSRVGIIPQDPVMFSATVRFNLDPFNKHTDQQVWDALEIVNMKEAVTSLPSQLSEAVAESGDNFSAGQRQLICIARALLRNPRILVLDEATASIDNETDAKMQLMVKERFKNCTVLTIAHRLHTIIDSDRVMVLDAGHLAEFDSPDSLLGKEGGMFRGLWERHQRSHGLTRSKSSHDNLVDQFTTVSFENDGEEAGGVATGKL